MNQLRALLFLILSLTGIYVFLRGWGYTSYQASMKMSRTYRAYGVKKKKSDFKLSKKLRDKKKIFLGLSMIALSIVIISFNIS